MTVGETLTPLVDDPLRFESALRRFDEENGLDRNVEISNSVAHPRELLYARRLTAWVLKLCPGASEELRLASRCQHICRWLIPRTSYEMSRSGYLRWRNDLKAFHATKAGEILAEVGYSKAVIVRVQDLILKRNFPKDSDSRTLEDALCLVFLEFQFSELASKTPDEKMINVLRKSWMKMTPIAQEQAARLAYGTRERALLGHALAGSE